MLGAIPNTPNGDRFACWGNAKIGAIVLCGRGAISTGRGFGKEGGIIAGAALFRVLVGLSANLY